MYSIKGGQYCHLGLGNALNTFLNNFSDASLETIQSDSIYLKINCDGLPIYKSSNSQFWPILVQFTSKSIIFDKSNPVIIGLFIGNCKPKCVREYLTDFISEFNALKNGYKYKKFLVPIKVR